MVGACPAVREPGSPESLGYRRITSSTSDSTELLLYQISHQEGNNETFPFPFEFGLCFQIPIQKIKQPVFKRNE